MIEAKEHLKPLYDFYGSYYLVKGSADKYRNLLEIHSKLAKSDDHYDAIVIMLNPGGSYPKDESCFKEIGYKDLSKNTLVPCEPDETQYQIVRLMKQNGWNKVGVINLFDICNSKSKEIIKTYAVFYNRRKTESIFCDERSEELSACLNKCKTNAPIVLAWGTDIKLSLSSSDAYVKLSNTGRTIIGYQNQHNSYYHPWPEGEYNEHIRKNWVGHVNAQIKS